MIFHTNGDTLYTNGYSGWMPIDTKTRYPAYYQDGMASREYLRWTRVWKEMGGSYQLDGSDYGDIFNIYESMLDNRYMDSSSYGMRRVNYQHLCTLPTSLYFLSVRSKDI